MKVKFRAVLYLLLISLFIGCNEVNNKINEGASEIERNEGKDDLQETLTVANEEELAIALKDDYRITIKNNIETNNELIMEGDFSKTDTTEGNKVSHIGRELNLFYIDKSNNVINSYTLSVPRLVIKSNDTTIKGGKIKGDIYVESDGLILDDTKVEGNLYFKDKKNKDSFKLENTASVSGDIETE
ncbi:hypothetical protein [Clostridium sp.]|uniref:hypothetical protein n=1 Tax=Clostridium sp. TaxID=1506 RepID=UPI002617F8CC|nr:hypothetical protein [Clostridium sp.]